MGTAAVRLGSGQARLSRQGGARRNLEECGKRTDNRCPLKTQPAYFRLNSALTCAVTVTICGVNSAVGAGGATLAIAVMA